MKPRMTMRSLRMILGVLLGLVCAGLLTSCVGEGDCSANCPQCEGDCNKTSGHSDRHECEFCGWTWH